MCCCAEALAPCLECFLYLVPHHLRPPSVFVESRSSRDNATATVSLARCRTDGACLTIGYQSSAAARGNSKTAQVVGYYYPRLSQAAAESNWRNPQCGTRSMRRCGSGCGGGVDGFASTSLGT